MRSTLAIFICSILVSGTLAQTNRKQFSGTLKPQDKPELKIEVKLNFDLDSVKGSYYYKSNGTDMKLAGTLTSKGNLITLNEYNPKGKLTGTFTGTYYQKGDSIKGTWTRKKDKSSMQFEMYPEEWTDYKLIEKKSIGPQFEMEWFEMRSHPDTLLQYVFNHLEPNTPRARNDSTPGYFLDEGSTDTIFYTMTTWAGITMKTNSFINFTTFNSDYWGGMGADNQIRYFLFDFESKEILNLTSILRDDTASMQILSNWIDNAMKNRNEWGAWMDSYERDDGPQEFYFANDGVYFFFPTGAISNILGFDDVKVSYRNFIKIIKRDNKIYEWMKSHPGVKN